MRLVGYHFHTYSCLGNPYIISKLSDQIALNRIHKFLECHRMIKNQILIERIYLGDRNKWQ
jgi:hypothetical protein